jgi:hypothetical protein
MRHRWRLFILTVALLGGGGLVCGEASPPGGGQATEGASGEGMLVAAAPSKGSGSGGMSEKEKAQKEPFPNDLGPDSIDVSGYPADMKKKYETFKQCAQCHTLARPINSQMHDRESWRRYVKRMMSKPGCEIKDGKAIFEFLTYDSEVRKIKRKAEFKAHRLKLLKEFKAKFPERYTLLFENRTPEQEVARELPGW